MTDGLVEGSTRATAWPAGGSPATTTATVDAPPLPARGDPNLDHLFGADGGGQCPGRAGGRTRKKEGPMGRLNQLPSSHSPRGERKLPSRVPLPAAVPVSVLALALTAVTTLVVTGATRAPDARALAAGTALDTPGLAHLVARCIALGGQFGLVGTVLILTAAAVAWHRRVWRPLLVPVAALAALNAATLALKLATGRTAPHAGIDLVFAGGWSYPSGHAVNATVCLPSSWPWATATPGPAPTDASGRRRGRRWRPRRSRSPRSDWRRSCWATTGPATWPPAGCSAWPERPQGGQD